LPGSSFSIEILDPGPAFENKLPAMSWNESEILAARRMIIDAARDMLAGKVSYIEGARKITASRFVARLEDDVDVLPFVGIASETEALPVGDTAVHWRPAAFDAFKPDIDKSEAWARQFGEPHCRSLLNRLASA
jgi:hypothetical protein